MGRQIYPSTAKFRAPDALIAAARQKAEHDGVTFSELVRGALRRELQDAA